MKKWFDNFKKSFQDMRGWQKVIYCLSFSLLVFLNVYLATLSIWWVVLLYVALAIFGLILYFLQRKLDKLTDGNGIVFGGRGKGKGLFQQWKINRLNKPYYSNVPFTKKRLEFSLLDYSKSIGDNTIEDIIANKIKPCTKKDYYEGINIFFDDVNIYAPNWLDYELKKLYPSLPPILAVNRHLYNAWMIITTQSYDRPYKVIRELQTDFGLKIVSTVGWGRLWSSIPILRNYVVSKCIYYESDKSAESGLLPFGAVGLVNEGTKHALLTSGQATKEVYEAQNGKIAYYWFINKKSKVVYDTRYFHRLFYGVHSPTTADKL